MRLDGSRKALGYRLTSQLLMSSSETSLKLCNLGLKESNNLVEVNWLWLQHGCSILFDKDNSGVSRVHIKHPKVSKKRQVKDNS